MAWPIVMWNGVEHYQAQGDFLIPVTPETGAAVIMLRRDGGVGDGFSAIEKGDPGQHAEISNTVDITELDPDDTSPPSAQFITLTPPTGDTPGVYQLALSLHRGANGVDGDTVLDPNDFDDPAAGYFPAVNNTLDGFELAPQKITEWFFPATVANTPSGNVSFTIGAVPIPSRPWARRIVAHGGVVVTGEGADVRVDLLARLNGETGGNIVGRCPGVAQTERLALWPGKAAGLATDYDVIAAGDAGTVHFRLERQSGTVTYTSTATTTRVSVEAIPL